MKNLKEYITEASNKLGYFMGKTSRRTQEDFKFTPGEKAIMITYSDSGYYAVPSTNSCVTIEKVGKNSVKIKHDDNTIRTDFKFDKYGISIESFSGRFGKYNIYRVLYNAELANDKDIKELLDTGKCSWEYGFPVHRFDEFRTLLRKLVAEVSK